MTCSSIIVEYIRKQYKGDLRKLVLYYFMDGTAADSDQLEDMLRSLIRQMITIAGSIPANVREVAKNHRQTGSFPKFDELSDIVCHLV